MANQYIANIQATAAGAGTRNSFIGLEIPSGLSVEIVRVRVSCRTAAAVDQCRVQFLRCSTVGATPTTATPIKKNPVNAASSVTNCNVKNGATAWATGSVVDILFDESFILRSILEWSAIDDDDKIIVDNSANFQVAIENQTTASLLMCVTLEWKED